MARYGGSQCQRNFKYLHYLRGVRDTYIRVPSSTTRDSIRHKMEKSGNFLPECKKEREKILRKSNIVGPSFFLSHFSVFHPFFVFSFFPAILDALSLTLSFASLLFSVLLFFLVLSPSPCRRSVLFFFPFDLETPGRYRFARDWHGQGKISSLPPEFLVDLSSVRAVPVGTGWLASYREFSQVKSS